MVVGELIAERDLVIIGGGPGGYTAAIRAAQLGREVTLIERDRIGGICLNEGCIPSKVTAVAAAKAAEQKTFDALGFNLIGHDFNKLSAYRESVVDKLRSGVEALLQANKIELVRGEAVFLSEDRIGVSNGHQFDTYRFKQAIIATGSRPEKIPGTFTPEELYALETLPEHLVVAGSDYIALEAAMNFKALGSDVTLVLPEELTFDETLTRELRRLMKKQGITLKSSGTLEKVEDDVAYFDGFSIAATHVLTTGVRLPNVEVLGLDRLGMEQSDDGTIVVSDHQTSIPSIFAIGDVTPGPRYAVRAIKEGKSAVDVMNGQPAEPNAILPVVLHTSPPVACVGMTEQEARDAGYVIRTGQFPLGANGYSAVHGETSGVVKVISDAETDIVLGIHMVGRGAIELSSSFVLALELVAKEEDLKFPLFAHPSTNEGLLEAVESLVGQAIHLPPKTQRVIR